MRIFFTSLLLVLLSIVGQAQTTVDSIVSEFTYNVEKYCQTGDNDCIKVIEELCSGSKYKTRICDELALTLMKSHKDIGKLKDITLDTFLAFLEEAREEGLRVKYSNINHKITDKLNHRDINNKSADKFSYVTCEIQIKLVNGEVIESSDLFILYDDKIVKINIFEKNN